MRTNLTATAWLLAIAMSLIVASSCGGGADTQNGRDARPAQSEQVTSPTVEPTATATVEPQLTGTQQDEIRAAVKQLFADGFRESNLSLRSEESRKKISGVQLATLQYLDLEYLDKLMDICDARLYGTPITSPDFTLPNNYNGPDEFTPGRTTDPTAPNYSMAILSPCEDVARAAKSLFNATGNAKFKEASDSWLPLHHQVVVDIRKRDPHSSESYWQAILQLDYNLAFKIQPGQ